ncbi:hypothetical protein Misp01_16500 [Microtetraspora sp. NBRC 13810]|uniref:SGNH/GDSL hydrolase family protein n=1 Tax=Microtetraspora sp. NBRC 13810 TaxID=3030990 RepID=UPI0024A1BAC0|nr:SGNH/GDSL hydrolase family protein [Microtetraspora sp. NBRC 13810]GLW06520.1 hypothetical protein Misp01_16500 [Microtetraspora sp. NBRC 13810]
MLAPRFATLLTSLLAAATAVTAVAATGAPAGAVTGGGGRESWSGVWSTALQRPVANELTGPNWSTEGFAAESVRQVVRVSAGGTGVRVRLSNLYGAAPLRLTGATVGKAGDGAAVRPGTLRPLTFGRSASVTVPPGRTLASDAVPLTTSPLEKLTVTLYFARPTGPATFHAGGLTTSYRAAGDRRFDHAAGAFGGETSQSWYYLAGVDVTGGPRRAPGVVVAFGDSITDGAASTPGADNRYPDELAERRTAAGAAGGVLNAGLNGNMLLTDSPCLNGDAGVHRFKRDVLDQPGVRTAIVLIGINDIALDGFDVGCGAPPEIGARELIEGHRGLIRAARAHGVKIIGATLPPNEGNAYYHSAGNEKVRVEFNDWMRRSGEYDAVVDLDRVLADPDHPKALLPAYDGGDALHPSDAGMKAIARAVRLSLL